jgi:hypothetical protein
MPKPYRNDQEMIAMNKFFDGIQDQLANRLKEVKAIEGVKAEVVDKKAIMGSYKNEPFCIYYLVYGMTGNEFASVLITRWKGKDHRLKKPADVLGG